MCTPVAFLAEALALGSFFVSSQACIWEFLCNVCTFSGDVYQFWHGPVVRKAPCNAIHPWYVEKQKLASMVCCILRHVEETTVMNHLVHAASLTPATIAACLTRNTLTPASLRAALVSAWAAMIRLHRWCRGWSIVSTTIAATATARARQHTMFFYLRVRPDFF